MLQFEEYQEFPQDVWGTKNPQAIHTAQQTKSAISCHQELVKLPSNKVMIESEFKIFDSIMKSIPQSNVSIVPLASHSQPIIRQHPETAIPQQVSHIPTKSVELQLNQKGIIVIALIFAGCIMSLTALIKVWGTTDIAQQQAYQERIDNQYSEIGKRYDRLAKATEKLGKKADVCVSFYCGGNNGRNDNQGYEESPRNASSRNNSHVNYGNISYQDKTSENQLDDQDYYNALIEVSQWKRKGHSKTKATAFSKWIQKNPRVAKSEGYPSFPAISKAILETY